MSPNPRNPSFAIFKHGSKADPFSVIKRRLNWISLAVHCLSIVICVIIAVRECADQEYFYATVAGVAALVNAIGTLRV
jgi:hypothetical protein